MSKEYVGTFWLDQHGHRYWVQGWSRTGDVEELRLVHVAPRDQTIGTDELERRFQPEETESV